MTVGEIETRVLGMIDGLIGLLELIEQGFMQHRMDHLARAMELEHRLNVTEKELTAAILGLSKAVTGEGEERRILALLQQLVVTLERMGDEAASIVERIEVKVSEKLLFSEKGLAQFNETYAAMRVSVALMRQFVERREPATRERVIDNGFHVKELVERYRTEHTERLIQGICTPMAANLFFDMLDFTGNLARHSSNIVKLF